jgi:hypothetical protein
MQQIMLLPLAALTPVSSKNSFIGIDDVGDGVCGGLVSLSACLAIALTPPRFYK